jgi:hypothetical protein
MTRYHSFLRADRRILAPVDDALFSHSLQSPTGGEFMIWRVVYSNRLALFPQMPILLVLTPLPSTRRCNICTPRYFPLNETPLSTDSADARQVNKTLLFAGNYANKPYSPPPTVVFSLSNARLRAVNTRRAKWIKWRP